VKLTFFHSRDFDEYIFAETRAHCLRGPFIVLLVPSVLVALHGSRKAKVFLTSLQKSTSISERLTKEILQIA
jgi:hypothetical protein